MEERLVEFAVMIIRIVEALPDNRIGNHIAGQLVRCGTSPAFNYGEAQSAESRKDFIHKIKVVLKELRETGVCLKLIHRTSLIKPEEKLHPVINECNELISIFVKSVSTAQQKQSKKVF